MWLWLVLQVNMLVPTHMECCDHQLEGMLVFCKSHIKQSVLSNHDEGKFEVLLHQFVIDS